MILRRYGKNYQSVELNFDSRAMTEIGFRRDHVVSIPTEEFERGYDSVETLELAADAEGAVHDAVEQEVLAALARKVREVEDRLGDGEVLVVESEQGNDYPKTRDRKTTRVTDGETRMYFHWTIDPPLRMGVYRKVS